MRRLSRIPPVQGLALLAFSAFAFAACNLDLSMRAEARDQWQRRYTLAEGGTLEIRNTNGLIQVQSGDGDQIEVTAERVVQASSDQAAKDGLAAFEIQESTAPDHITLDSTNRGLNVTIGQSRRVEYHVRVPRWTNVRLETTNGNIDVAGPLGGTFRAQTTNGRIDGKGLENGARASTTNGAVALEVSKLGKEGISCETTNGQIELSLPSSVNARLSARVTNGAIQAEGLALNVTEQSRRRLDATIGSGGPTINLETTNGAIEIRAR
jgi:hypothetical protein